MGLAGMIGLTTLWIVSGAGYCEPIGTLRQVSYVEGRM